MSITRESIEEELYNAIEAIEKGDLVRARGCTARAHADICEKWKTRNGRKETLTKPENE